MKKRIYTFLLAIGYLSTSHAQIISTIAGNGSTSSPPTGDGGPATAGVVGPNRIALDSRGNLYISDQYERKIDRKGIITNFAGNGLATGDGVAATTSSMYQPNGEAADMYGNVYINDLPGNRVRVVDKYGIIHTYAGGGSAYPYDGGPATSADIHWGLIGMTIDNAGSIYICPERP